MNPKYERLAVRLRELMAMGEPLASRVNGRFVSDRAGLHAWLVSTENIINMTFGQGSAHARQLAELLGDGAVVYPVQVRQVAGLLRGALNDLEGGFLVGQEQLIAGAIFDDVLEQAAHLVTAGYKDPAAVLVRVVVEDALKRRSRDLGLPDSSRASALNDALKVAGAYGTPQWRLVQRWLDIGNAAAHGDFDDYDDADVTRSIEDVRRFLASG